jgi:uncharacterized protein with PCYCGC motif
MKKILVLVLLSIVIGLIASSIISREQQTQTPSVSTTVTTEVSPAETTPAPHNHEAMERVPAFFRVPPSENSLPPTLTPEAFTGNVRLAYQAAQEIPETLAQIPCYCHCDMSKGHKSLHSCFEDQHGENCGICIGEALMARTLQRQGLTPAQIRERVINAYGKQN